MTFDSCIWSDYAGEAVNHFANAYLIPDVAFIGCKFLGGGNLTNGISLQYNSSVRWQIVGCEFNGLTGAGIINSNGSQSNMFSVVKGNVFKSCANGFVVTQNGGINYVIDGNYFESITGWCIDHSSVATLGNLYQVTFSNNVAGASVTNGFRIAVTTGAWDYCINTGNNWHNASGTKYTVSAGNANGYSANNITV